MRPSAGVAALAVLLLGGCAPAPAVAPGPASATGVGFNTFTVTVTAMGPPVWSYTLKSVNLVGPPGTAPTPGFFTGVEAHSTCPLDAAKLTVLLEVPGAPPGTPVPAAAPGAVISQPAPTDIRVAAKGAPAAGWSTLIVSLEADCRNGSVDFIFDDFTVGAPNRVVVGPVAGPTL